MTVGIKFHFEQSYNQFHALAARLSATTIEHVQWWLLIIWQPMHLMGFNVNFSTVKHFYMYCVCLLKNINEDIQSRNLRIHTKTGYDNNVEDASKDSSLASVNGIKEASPGFPPDTVMTSFNAYGPN